MGRQGCNISRQEAADYGVKHLKKYEVIYIKKPLADDARGHSGRKGLEGSPNTKP
jgi:hypothetical protein